MERTVRSIKAKKQDKLAMPAERREYEKQKKADSRKQRMVKQSMAEENTVADEDDGIMSRRRS